MAVDLQALRQHPSDAFIEALRAKYPTEPEVDRVLTRKMRQRSSSMYTGVTLETMVESTTRLIARDMGDRFTIINPRWLTGGASKIQMAFDLVSAVTTDAFQQGVKTPLVVRMEPAESVVETSRLREFEVLKLLSGVVPVPPCYWLDIEGEVFPYPALIYGYVAGSVKPVHIASKQVTGIGINFGPELRKKLAPQFVRHLAACHTIDEQRLQTLTAFEIPTVGSNDSVIKQLNWWKRVWEEDCRENIPLMDVAYQWLVDNAPPLETVSIVHGDYRSGNFLFDEASAEITAILDWELILLGDRHQDLAWSTYELFGHMAEDDSTALMCGLLPEQEFFALYEQYSGLKVDPERLLYYRILCNFMSVTHALATAYRAASGGKTHQDVVITSFSKIGYILLEQLRKHLEGVL